MNNKKLLLLVFFVCVFVVLHFAGAGHYLTLKNLQEKKVYFGMLAKSNPIFAPLIFILIYFLGVTFSLPGAAVLTVAGGFLFGILPAVVYVNIAATAGAVAVFLLVRYLWELKKDINSNILKKHGHYYLLVLRLIPIFPFFLVNIFAARTKMSLKTYTWATALGIIPGTFLYASAGSQLATINKLSDVLTWQSLLILFGLALFAISPILWKKRNHSFLL